MEDGMNDKAIDQFISKTQEARDLLERISAELEEHMNAHPDRVHWGHVGDANYVLESLRDVARFMGHAQ
jgi:hypothetical protein